MKSNSDNQFVVKPWGDADRSIIGIIWNRYLKYRAPENFIEHKQDVVDRVFGKDTDFSRDVLRFENEKGEIVGYAGITNNSNTAKTWKISSTILPEYLESSLPNLLVKECISLAERSKPSEVHFRIRGDEKIYEQELQGLGYEPFHYMWGMIMGEIGSKSIPAIKNPEGVSIQQVEGLKDYSQYASVENAAFRGAFECKERTPEECKKLIDFQRNYFEVRIFLAYEDNILAGFGLIVIDKKNNIGYGRSLAVHPDYQNRGIGSAIISSVLEYLQKEGVNEYRFHVDGENEGAMDLYKSFGFQELEKTTIKFFHLK